MEPFDDHEWDAPEPNCFRCGDRRWQGSIPCVECNPRGEHGTPQPYNVGGPGGTEEPW